MKPLYEIANHYQFLLTQLVDEETGEVNETVLSELDNLNDDAETKCINIVKIFKEFEKEYHAISEERKRMAKREKSYKDSMASLKNYLEINMERCHISKIECPQFVIILQKNRHSVDIEDESQIPEEYKKITVEYKREEMRKEMEHGVYVPGAKLIQTKSVRIR